MKRFVSIALLSIIPFLAGACGGTNPKSETPAEVAVSAEPISNTESVMSQAEALVYAQNYKGAIQLLDDVIKTNGPSAYALTLRGISHAKLGNVYQSERDLVDATKIDYSATTLSNIGNAELMFGNCERAADAFNKAIILDPNNYKLLVNLSSAYLCYTALDLAESTLNRALQLHAEDEVLLTNRAIFYAMKEDFQSAKISAQQAIAINPAYPPAYKALAQVLHNLGLHAEAAEAEKQHKTLMRGSGRVRQGL